MNKNSLIDYLGLCIEDGYEMLAIRDVVRAFGKTDEALDVREKLIECLFNDKQLDEKDIDNIRGRYANYFDRFDVNSVTLDRCSASLVGFWFLEKTHKKEALEYLRRTAEWGYANAQYLLGAILKTEENTAYEGRYWISLAAQKGYKRAERELGFLLLGDGTKNGLEMGVQMLESSEQAGYIEASFMKEYKRALVLSHEPEDRELFLKTVDGLKIICDDGFFRGYDIIAKLLIECDHRIKKNQIVHFLKKAADFGYHDDAYALSKFFAKEYESGNSKQMLADALHYAEIASRAKGRKYQINYGVILFSADRYDDAREIFEKYARKGDGFALRELGLMHQQGKGFEPDFDKAVSFYKQAIDAGYAEAEFDIGYAMYYLKKDPECIDIFIKGGEDGFNHCYFTLAEIYSKGELVEVDEEKADYYYNLATQGISSKEINGIA